MKNWLTSFFLLFALASGALAGTSVFSDNAKNGMSTMECCKKKTKDCSAKTVSAAQLCCAINCGNPAPSSLGASFNFSPVAVIVSDSILKQIAALLNQEKPITKVAVSSERKTVPKKFQPKYIQHHSFLI